MSLTFFQMSACTTCSHAPCHYRDAQFNYFCSRKCHVQAIKNRMLSREFDKKTREEIDFPSFKTWQDQKRLHDMIYQSETPVIYRGQEWALVQVLRLIAASGIKATNAYKIGSGQGGTAYRVVIGADESFSKEAWRPSVVLKLTKTSERGPFDPAQVEVAIVRALYFNVFETKVSPHVPIYYGAWMNEKKTVYASDFAQFGPLDRYMRRVPMRDRIEALEVFLFQIVYTLEALQRVFPGMRHVDLHDRNCLVRAYDYEHSTLYESPAGVAFLPNIGAQVILADWDWAFIPGYVENYKPLIHPIGDYENFSHAYNYENLPQLDVFRIYNAFSIANQNYQGGSKLITEIDELFKNVGIDPTTPAFAPDEPMLWPEIPTALQVLQIAQKYFSTPIPGQEVSDRFSSVNFPKEKTHIKYFYDPRNYYRYLPLETTEDVPMPKTYLDAQPFSESKRRELFRFKAFQMETVKFWIARDAEFIGEGDEIFYERFADEYESQREKIPLPELYDGMIAFAVYVQLMQHYLIYPDPEIIIIEFKGWSTGRWGRRVFDHASKGESAMEIMSEILLLSHRIKSQFS